MYKLQFTLKQHTPLIHFQHDQEGATLRATEVKPKLDRFIITKLGGIKDARAAHPEWFISDKHDALDYKMRIDCGNEIPELCTEIEKKYTAKSGKEMDEKFPAFFGLMGGENKGSKKFAMHDSIKMSIVSGNQGLIAKIKSNIHRFLMTNNFGNRQSKGFGSFYLDTSDPLYKDVSNPEIRLAYWFDFTVNPKNKFLKTERPLLFKAQFELFETINLFYTSLRNGMNIYHGPDKPVLYLKSMLFLYAKSKGIQWEKKKIKEEFYSFELNQQKTKHPKGEAVHHSSNEVNLVRDIMGLASDSDWLTPYRDVISKSSGNIDRYQSPILFKPIEIAQNQFRVFFEAVNENPEIYNQTFMIASKKKNKNFMIKTPKAFNFEEFFTFAFSHKPEDLASYPNSKPIELNKLTAIYNDIRKNKGK